jgi:anti-sigma B factor antagonist
MHVTMNELDGLRRVVLDGRLDTAGVGVVELSFTAMTVSAGKPVVVDLAAVSFLASLGVRMFIGTARSVAAKGNRLVFYNATPAVMEIIDTMGLAEIIDIAETEADAMALVQA